MATSEVSTRPAPAQVWEFPPVTISSEEIARYTQRLNDDNSPRVLADGGGGV